jgi:glutamine amidotransferase
MLCVIPPQVLPSREKLENSALNNPDGFGFAIAIPSEGRLIVEHTMSADDSINSFLALRAKYPEGYAIWHARYATHGSTTLDNCHPFYVGTDGLTVLAHNGVLPTEEGKGELRSDTRIFAEDILASIGGVTALDNPQIYNMLEDFSTGSKIAVLTVDPRAKYDLYLLHENKGDVDETGVWWSNSSCDINYYAKPALKYNGYYDSEWGGSAWGMDSYTPSNSKSNQAPMLDHENKYQCEMCMAVLDADELENTDYVCVFCQSCQLCTMSVDSCMCYKKPKGGKIHEPKQVEQVDDFPKGMYEYTRSIPESEREFSMQWSSKERKWLLLDGNSQEIPESVWNKAVK